MQQWKSIKLASFSITSWCALIRQIFLTRSREQTLPCFSSWLRQDPQPCAVWIVFDATMTSLGWMIFTRSYWMKGLRWYARTGVRFSISTCQNTKFDASHG